MNSDRSGDAWILFLEADGTVSGSLDLGESRSHSAAHLHAPTLQPHHTRPTAHLPPPPTAALFSVGAGVSAALQPKDKFGYSLAMLDDMDGDGTPSRPSLHFALLCPPLPSSARLCLSCPPLPSSALPSSTDGSLAPPRRHARAGCWCRGQRGQCRIRKFKVRRRGIHFAPRQRRRCGRCQGLDSVARSQRSCVRVRRGGRSHVGTRCCRPPHATFPPPPRLR